MRILEVGVGHRESLSNVVYGREGRQLIAADSKRLVVWSLETFEQQYVLSPAAQDMWMRCLFLPGGKAYLEANDYWKVGDDLPNPRITKPGQPQQIPNLTSLTGFLCFASDGRSWLRETYGQPWQSPQRIALWDFAGVCLRTYPQAGAGRPHQAAFSQDGTILAFGGGGYTTRVALWDAIAREPIVELEHTDQLFGLTFSPDGTRLATSAGRTVRVWSVPEGRCLHKFRSFRAYTECRAFSPDGKMLVAGSREGRVRIWDLESGRELSDHNWQQGDVSDVAFSPDGLTAAAACRKQVVVIWDVDF